MVSSKEWSLATHASHRMGHGPMNIIGTRSLVLGQKQANKLNREYTSEFQKMQKKTTKMRHSLVCSFRVVLYSALMARAHTVVAARWDWECQDRRRKSASRVYYFTLYSTVNEPPVQER